MARGLLRVAACTGVLASTSLAGARGSDVLGFSAGLSQVVLRPSLQHHHGICTASARTTGRPRHAALGNERRRDGAHMTMSPDKYVGTGSEAAGAVGDDSTIVSKPCKNWAQVVWEFSRPHTIIGSVLSVISLHLFAATASGMQLMNLSALGIALSWAIACAVLINIYVTGLNQVFDVEIDKINKPYLPIAAGYLSLPAAWAICIGALLLGTVPSIIAYPFDKVPLLSVTLGSALLGTAYSAPPLRLKRFPLFAALCIIVVSACGFICCCLQGHA